MYLRVEVLGAVSLGDRAVPWPGVRESFLETEDRH